MIISREKESKSLTILANYQFDDKNYNYITSLHDEYDFIGKIICQNRTTTDIILHTKRLIKRYEFEVERQKKRLKLIQELESKFDT